MLAPHHSNFYRPDALPDSQPTVSKCKRRYIVLNRNSGKKGLLIHEKCILYCIPSVITTAHRQNPAATTTG